MKITVLISIIAIAIFIAVIVNNSINNRESYFTFYNGMPIIPKTFISTTFVRPL